MQTMKRDAGPSLAAWVLGAVVLATASPAVAEEASEEAEPAATTTIEERLDVEDSAPYIPTSNTIAAKLPIEQAWTPANIGAVSARLMTEQHAETVGDALENVSGIHAQTGSGIFDFLVIRGFDSLSSGLVLIDGAPEPESTFYQLHDAERVEVFKGPAGFLYGSNPLAGVVNIVRKQPVPHDFATFGFGIGSFGTTTAHFDLNASSDDGAASFRLNGHWRESDGFRDGRDQALAAIHPGFAWRPDDRQSLTVNLDLVSSDYRPDAGVPIVDGRPADVARERSYASPLDDSMQDITRVQVDYELNLGDRLTLRDKLYYRELDWQTSGTLISGLLPLGTDSLVFRTLLGLDDRQRFFGNQFELLWRNERHRLLAGIEAQRTTDDFSLSVGLLPTISLLQPAAETTDIPVFPLPGQGSTGDTESSVLAPYVVDQITISDRVRVLLGARFDTIDFDDRVSGTSRSDSELSPMAGLVFAPAARTSLYANAARSFAPASPRVAGDREPEESRQYEIGLRRSFAGGRLDGVLAVYQLERDNIAIPDDNGFTQQAGDQRSRGVEIELGGELGNRLSGSFSYAFTEAELTRFAELVFLPGPPFFLSLDRSGNTPAFAPENLFNAWLSRSFPSGLQVGGGLRWVDSQFIAEDNATELDAYALLDATLSYGKGSWRFSLNLQNLADEDYETRGFGSFSVIPGEPISAGLRIEYRM
jgi:catecholate siderophore receptor